MTREISKTQIARFPAYTLVKVQGCWSRVIGIQRIGAGGRVFLLQPIHDIAYPLSDAGKPLEVSEDEIEEVRLA